jgi:serine protease inhibitor
MDGEAALKAVVGANSELLSRLHPLLVRSSGQGENLAMSLFSLSSVLAMAYVGARGNTHGQMRRALAFPSNKVQLFHLFQMRLKCEC